MGIKPEFVFVSAGLKKNPKKTLKEIYKGIKKACKKWHLKVGGGDIVRSPKIFLSITAVGSGRKPVKRTGSKKGDLVFITGFPGLSEAGLRCLLKKRKKEKIANFFLYPQIYPEIALKIAPFVNCMIDSSDGLYKSLLILSQLNGMKFEIESRKIPISPLLLDFAKTHRQALKIALTGGEDYNLIGTVSPDKFDKIKGKVFVIGKVGEGKGVCLDGKKISMKSFEHF